MLRLVKGMAEGWEAERRLLHAELEVSGSPLGSCAA